MKPIFIDTTHRQEGPAGYRVPFLGERTDYLRSKRQRDLQRWKARYYRDPLADAEPRP